MYKWLVGLRVVLSTGEIVKIVGYSCLETLPPQNVQITIEHADGETDTYSELDFIQNALGMRLGTTRDEEYD